MYKVKAWAKFILFLIVVVSPPVIALTWHQRKKEEFAREVLCEGYGPGDGWDYGV